MIFLVLWNPTESFNQFINDDDSKKYQTYYIFTRKLLCIEMNYYISHIFYGFKMSPKIAVINLFLMEIFLSHNLKTVFYWGCNGDINAWVPGEIVYGRGLSSEGVQVVCYLI